MGLFDRCHAGYDRGIGIARVSLALGIIDPVQSRPQLGDMHLPDLSNPGSECRVGKGECREAVV